MAKKTKAKPKKTKPSKKTAKKVVSKPAKKIISKPAKKLAKAKPAKKPAKPPAVAVAPAATPAAAAPPIVVVAAPTATPIVAAPPAAPAPAAKPAKAAKPGKTPSLNNQRKALLDAKTIPELRVMLKRNDQITTGDKAKLVKRILDCVANGALPRCPSCGLGRLKASKYSGFRCPGGYDDDEYVFCGFTANIGEIERPAWQFETPGGLL